jgi:hypothetical protein
MVGLLWPTVGQGQTLRVDAFGVAATNAEVEDIRQTRGLGAGIGAMAEWSRWRAEARYFHSALQADFSIQPDYDVDEIDVAGTWFWRPYLAPQVGVSRRFVSPEFAAQEVGFVRAGLLSEVRLARLAGLWVRGSWLPYSRFSGGGSAGFGVEVGLGVTVGAPTDRFQGFAAFEYQRIDRETSADAPLQFSIGQLGARMRL